MYKTKLVLLGLVLSTSMGFANSSCAPTELEILGVDKGKTWLKFIDNSDGDYFSFEFLNKKIWISVLCQMLYLI